jgi:hypothetical protein
MPLGSGSRTVAPSLNFHQLLGRDHRRIDKTNAQSPLRNFETTDYTDFTDFANRKGPPKGEVSPMADAKNAKIILPRIAADSH